MRRWLIPILIPALLAACGSFSPSFTGDPDRLVHGVSVARPAAGDAEPDDAVTQALNWKVSQICTHGADRLKQDIEPAEDGQQLIDWQLRCKPYHLSL
jgi:hypothetical protein